jgi:drug/metabolite transporter (DMT)-like permease
VIGKERSIYGILCAVVTIWGLNVVMVKYLTFFPPVLIAAIRITVGSLVLLPMILWKNGFVTVKRQDLLLITGVALTMITLHQITLAWGLQYTTAGTGSLILGLNPLSTALLAMIFLGEELTRRKVLGVLLGFGGVLIVVTSGSGSVEFGGWGDLIMFVSMLMYVVGGLLVRTLTTRGVPVLIVTGYSHAIAACLLWIISVSMYPADTFASIDTRPFTWLVIFASGGISTGLGTIGWNYGIRQLGASRTAVFLNGMPLASLIFAALLLGEELKWVHALAFVLVVLGVYLGSQMSSNQIRQLNQAEA